MNGKSKRGKKRISREQKRLPPIDELDLPYVAYELRQIGLTIREIAKLVRRRQEKVSEVIKTRHQRLERAWKRAARKKKGKTLPLAHPLDRRRTPHERCKAAVIALSSFDQFKGYSMKNGLLLVREILTIYLEDIGEMDCSSTLFCGVEPSGLRHEFLSYLADLVEREEFPEPKDIGWKFRVHFALKQNGTLHEAVQRR